jgi:hypothetical protein
LIGEEKNKLSYKFNAVNKKAPYEISHHDTNHALALQRSAYIIIDDNVAKKNILENYFQKYMNQYKENSSSMKDYYEK